MARGAADTVRAPMRPGAALPHLPALDGLRGIAILTVLAFHLDLLDPGFLGVDLFFVLSGFLITRLLLARRGPGGEIELGRFWAGRFRRLLPAAVVTVLMVAVLAWAGVLSSPELRGDLAAALGYVANWRLVLTGDDYASQFLAPSPVRHFWSLAVEEQFYLFWPLVVGGGVAIARRRGWTAEAVLLPVAVVGALASAVLLWQLHDPGVVSRAYYGTDSRMFGPLVGVVVALLTAERRRPLEQRAWRRGEAAAAWAAVVVGVWAVAGWTVSSETYYRGGALLFAVGVAALIALTLVRPVPPLAWGPLCWVGTISYGLYLFHWPIFLVLDEERTGVSGPALVALRLGVTFGVAAVSFRWLEEPIRRGRAVTRRPGPVLVGAVAIAAVAVALVPVPDPEVDLDEIDLAAAPPEVDGTGAGEPLRVMVVGDSVGNNLGAGMERWAAGRDDVVVWNRASAACGFELEVLVTGGTPAPPLCHEWKASLPSFVVQFRPDVVFVLVGRGDQLQRESPEWGGSRRIGDPEFDALLRTTYADVIAELEAEGADVVLSTFPCLDEIWVYGDRPAPDGRMSNDTNAMFNDLLRTFGRPVVDLDTRVCPDGEYTSTVEGIEGSRPDGLHFTDEAAEALAPWIHSEIVRLTQPT